MIKREIEEIFSQFVRPVYMSIERVGINFRFPLNKSTPQPKSLTRPTYFGSFLQEGVVECFLFRILWWSVL